MPYNEKSKAYVTKYKANNIKRVPLDMQRTLYEAIQAHAEARGESVNGFIKRAISEAMERDNTTPGASEGYAEAKEEDT